MKHKSLIIIASFLIVSIGAYFLTIRYYFTSSSSYIPENDIVEVKRAYITVTQDFGSIIILEESLELASQMSVLDALEMVALVETRYGGEFVSSINSIHSTYPEENYDWFFYVNGFLAREGAGDYIIEDGDVIQWDFHSWDFHHFQSAIAGNYPVYLVKGYAGKVFPTLIVFEEDFSKEAEKIKRQLEEEYTVTVTLKPVEDLSDEEKSTSNIVLLASSENELVMELNQIHDKIGFFAFFEDQIITDSNSKSKFSHRWEKAGMIQVSQNIWNPKGTLACENIILLISGTDPDSIKTTVDVLTGEFTAYRYSFGLIITEEGIIRIPS